MEGVADSAASLLKLFSGAWSDRLGRRRGFVLVGYALAAAARPVMGVVTAPWQLFVARSADRIGKGLRTSPRDAMIADSTQEGLRGRAFGFHRAMDHIGAAIGPIVATAFLWSWPDRLRTLFVLTLLPGLAVVLLLAVGLKEAAASEPARERVRLTLEPFHSSFRRLLVALVVFTLGNATDAFLLVRAGELGVPTAQLPILWLAFHVVKSSGNLMVGPLVDRIGPRRPLLAGWLLYAAVYAGFAAADSTWHAWALFLVYGGYYALAEPAEKTLVTHLAGPEWKGLAFGWYNFAVGASALPASVIFGGLYQELGHAVAFSWGAALALVATLLATRVRGSDCLPT